MVIKFNSGTNAIMMVVNTKASGGNNKQISMSYFILLLLNFFIDYHQNILRIYLYINLAGYISLSQILQQKKLMNIYPLKDINREVWEKKVSSTTMYTIPAEDEAFPVLQELNEILSRLITHPIKQTLDESLIEYFFSSVFPTVCLKIIRSKYFKNPEVLKYSNFVLQKSVCLVALYLDVAIKHPKFLEILVHVYSDEYYFKNNNQMHYMIYPYSYFPNIQRQMTFTVGDFIDVLKIGNLYEKVSWSQGQIKEVFETQIEIQYLYDGVDKRIRLKKDSPQIAPFKSKSLTFDWRMSLKVGDLVDVEDSFGSWYNGTVIQIIEKDEGKKNIKVTLKVYNQQGNKQDEQGNYFGFTQYEQILDFTSPKLAPFSTVAKLYCYESTKTTSFDSVQDLNDYEFKEINGTKIYALPRRKCLSKVQFDTINQFGRLGGFDNYMNYLEKQINFDILCYFVKGISGVSGYLHRELVTNLIERLKAMVEKYLFGSTQKSSKLFTKQQSEMLFSGLRGLQKRLYSTDFVSKYENNIKMLLAESCLQSEAIKNKLIGLNQLKDIFRSVTYSSTQKNKYIKQWVKNNKIFEKVYIINSHVQLIKKSEEFFKYLINQNILQVTDLQRLYKLAQKGDFESRVALYKLFQEVSHIFKKQHVYFLIDTILQSELNLILNEDIDLLHELSRFSNYFPLEKVISFFESIILGETKVKQLNDYAIKKYSEIVAKNQDVKPYRRNIIKNFLQKLSTHDISQIAKVLKGIFQGIGIGDWGKKDLNQILQEQKIQEVVVQTLRKIKDQPEFSRSVTIILDFLLFIYKLSSKIKINIKTLVDIWAIVQGNEQKQKEFYRWANQISKCEQGFQGATIQQLEMFYRKLFTPQQIPSLQGSQFELAKSFFVEINKKLRYITVVNTFKERQLQKQYKRKVEMKSLKLIDIIIQMIYNIKLESINNLVLNFFIQLYTSKDNSQEQIDQFLNKLLADFKQQYESKNYPMLVQTIKLIQAVINDSEKNVQTRINSLISKKESDSNKFIIINQVNYCSIDSQKKSQLVLPMNTTIIKLRKILAKQFNLTWQEVKIVSHKQIEDYQNSRTFKEIKLNPNQPLTISRRMVGSQVEQELIINDQMNPKAVRCFKIIFQKYSTNGKMDKNQCNSFTTICLGSSCTVKFFNEKIANLYGKYDDDNDGLLTFDNFLKFYEDASKDRAHTVWSNLRSFGVKGDFKFNYEPEQLIEVTKYPRNIIADYPKVYDILFDLLHIKQVASVAFQLLERLPVSKGIQEQLLNIQTQEDLQKILSTSDMYELSYKMNIIQYLAHSNELQTQTQKKWHHKFIEIQGYQLLYHCLQKNIVRYSTLSKEQGKQSDEDINIIQEVTQTSLNLLNEYWLECFSADPTKVRLSLSFISADQDMDDKLDYLIYGRFFKSDKKLEPKASKLPSQANLYIWRGIQKPDIKQFLVQQFNKKWSEASTVGKSQEKIQKKYNFFNLLSKIMDSLNILCMNEDPTQIISIMQNILEKIPNLDIVKRFYCFILSQCFFVAQPQYQGAYIRQLFKNLAKGSLTSEHFRVLAALVSRFGISNTSSEGEQSDEITSKLKEVLFNNVLNNVNELTVEGCAKLLTHFNLQETNFQILQKIWNNLLFNPYSLIQKEQSKAALYDLIIKICNSNDQLANKIIKIAVNTLNKYIKNMKIVYCNQYKQRSATGYAGLKNLGSTCYINSMIQQLFMNKNFRYCLLRADDGELPNLVETIDNKNQSRIVDDNFLHQIQRIFASLQLTNRIDFAPRDFCVAYKPFGQSVNVIIQQDVQEFVSMFFDRLEACLSKTLFKKLVQDFYLGKTANLFKCHSCSQTKKVQQTFHSISLDVKSSKTLDQSFNRFQHGEMITDYKCQFCNNKVDVTKMTRISTLPKILIIHLQRIVFSLDTFINQKITTKHSFPHQFNLYQSTLDCYQGKSKTGGMELPQEYLYELIGIICHSGTADSGHYISYIKTSENKWIEFNDSQVTTFNPTNIESQCFGGYTASSSYDDDYFEQKKQSSKSAYVLLYQRKGANTIELVLNKQLQKCKNQKQKQRLKESILKTLDLQQLVTKLNNQNDNRGQEGKMSEGQNIDTATPNMESHEQSQSAPDDSQKQATKLLQQKEIQIRRHQSEDNIETNVKQQLKMEQNKEENKQKTQQNKQEQSELIIHIKDPVSSFIPEQLRQEIIQDNQIHFFQKCFSAASFVKFFAQLLSKATKSYEQVLPICQKLTFGFWLKSPAFKDLLSMIDKILKQQPQGFQNIVTNNPAIISLLIQSSDSQIRTSMATFLSKVIADTIESKNINIRQNNQDPIFKFLDKLLSLLPSTVSKCWTKFGQYFQFWYELSTKNQVLVEYMIDREIIKHFMDYFLDTKSPLKIYATKRQHQIGSSYANPNFSMLLKCVFSLLQQRMIINQKNTDKSKHLSSNPDQQKLLMSFESLEKLITDNYQNIAAQLIKQICPNNLPSSQKAAIIIVKGLSKSNSQTVQPYLEVLHQFVLIQDQYQDLRIKWVIGKQTLALSNQNLKLTALNNYSLDERLYNYDSSFSIENGCSLIEPILTYYRRIQTFALLCTRQVLKLCQVSVKIRLYISSLDAPTLIYSSLTEFLKSFVEKYYQDHKKSYGFYSSSVGFNREQLGKEVKELAERVWKIMQEDERVLNLKKPVNEKQVQIQNPKQNSDKDQREQQKDQKEQEKENIQQVNTALSTPINQNNLNQQHIIQFTEVTAEEKITKQFQIVQSEYPSLYDTKTNSEQNVQYLIQKLNSKDSENKIQLEQEIYTKDVYKKNSAKSSSNYANYDEEDDWGYEDIKAPDETQNTKSGSARGNTRRGGDNQQYTITVTQQNNQKAELNYSEEEDEEPLMKTKNSNAEKQKEKEKQAQSVIAKDYRQTWHPVKFQYNQTGYYALDEKFFNVKIEQHQSEVTYLLTKPTGQTNRSFASVGGAQKNFERILEETWKNKKKIKVHGYLVKNSSREGIRIQTEDGCVFCRCGQNLLIWSDKILRVWESERCLDWPKWKIYSNEDK